MLPDKQPALSFLSATPIKPTLWPSRV